MTNLIAQVTSMSTQHKRDNDNDNKSHRTRNNKHKAKEGGAGRTGSGDKGESIPIRYKLGHWTLHGKFNFPLAKGVPFLASKIKWDPSWPADKEAYYNARKEVQERFAAGEKKDSSKAQQIAELKKQLAALESDEPGITEGDKRRRHK